MRISPFSRAYLRKRSTELMTDTCVAYRAGGPTLDRNTFRSTRATGTSKYTGPCRYWAVQEGAQVLMGDEQVTVTETFVSLPFDAPELESDDIVQITSSDDPTLVGTTVAVIGASGGGGLRGSRRYSVRVVEFQR